MDVRTFAQRVQDVGETLGDVPLRASPPSTTLSMLATSLVTIAGPNTSAGD